MSSVNVNVTADPAQALEALSKVKAAVDTIHAASVKTGYRTTEFWLVLLSYLATAGTYLFHQDFSGYVQLGATVASGVATAVYALVRAHLKRPVTLGALAYDLKALIDALDSAKLPPSTPV